MFYVHTELEDFCECFKDHVFIGYVLRNHDAILVGHLTNILQTNVLFIMLVMLLNVRYLGEHIHSLEPVIPVCSLAGLLTVKLTLDVACNQYQWSYYNH